jgi:hypothetical protein
MHDFAMAGQAFDFFMTCVRGVQLLRSVIWTDSKCMAIHTHRIRDLANVLNLSFMAGILTTCIIGNKFQVVDLNKTTINNLFRDSMAIKTFALNEARGIRGAFDKMTGKANLFLHRKVLFSLIMVMACAAGNINPVKCFLDMPFVTKFNATKKKIFLKKLGYAVAGRPQTGFIQNGRLGLGANPANHTVYGLGQTIDLALDIPAEPGLQVAA